MTAQDKPTPGIGRRILRASIVVVVAHALFKLAGLIQLMVLGRCIDAATFEAVYATAFEGWLFSIFLIGEEVIGPAFLPVFMGEMDTRDENAAWSFSNTVLSVQFLILLAVCLLVMLFPGHAIRLITAWSPSAQVDKYELARGSLVWMAPALICLSLGSTTYMILNGYKRFFLAAFGDASWKFTVVVAVALGVGVFGMDHRALIFGLVLGSVAKLLTHLLGMLREARFIRPKFDLRNPAFRTLVALMLPLICGILFAKVRDVFNHVWVLSNIKTDGLMQANLFGRKLYGALGWLVPYALSIAMFPFLCELVDRDDRKQFGEILSNSARMLLSVFIPFSLVCLVLAKPISFFLFHGGKVTEEVAGWTSVSMACYTLVLPAAAVEYLLMQAFFANRKMISVTVIGMIFSALSMAVSYAAVVVCGMRGAAALAAIALGFTLSRTLKSATLAIVLKRKIDFFPFRETALFLLRATATGIAAMLLSRCCVTGFERFVSAGTGKFMLLLKLLSGGFGAAAGFLLGVWVFRLKEPVDMVKWALEWVRKKGTERDGEGQKGAEREE